MTALTLKGDGPAARAARLLNHRLKSLVATGRRLEIERRRLARLKSGVPRAVEEEQRREIEARDGALEEQQAQDGDLDAQDRAAAEALSPSETLARLVEALTNFLILVRGNAAAE